MSDTTITTVHRELLAVADLQRALVRASPDALPGLLQRIEDACASAEHAAWRLRLALFAAACSEEDARLDRRVHG